MTLLPAFAVPGATVFVTATSADCPTVFVTAAELLAAFGSVVADVAATVFVSGAAVNPEPMSSTTDAVID